MKKLLFQLDTDPQPSVFDSVVAYDGGADHVIGHANVNPDNVTPLVEGAIFTRSPKEKKNTALFIGGSNMAAGEALLEAVRQQFFDGFRVSVMLDSNGSNTTAAAAVARLLGSGPLAGKKAVILGGTGPVGLRAAVMLHQEGAEVYLVSRDQGRAQQACDAVNDRFQVAVTGLGATTDEERAACVADANVIVATGAAGVQLLAQQHWQDNPNIEMLADANATPPLGIEGVDMLDRGEQRHGKVCWGAIGFGTLKLALHRACIAKLFTSHDQILDAEEIFALAKSMT
ncbi:MAG: NADP-dependent methylenetetrahydromethanopterin/methylenetetrahydrofolate dehydrogenase [Gammaproteobacteria bacterium]